MNKLLSRFRSPRLRPFERAALDAVGAKMDARAGARLAAQIEVVDRIERLANGKEVTLYSKRWIAAGRGEDDRVPDSASEAPLATAWLTRPGSAARLKVDVWLAEGHLFALGFADAPIAFFGSDDLDAIDADVVEVAIWRDPMTPTGDEEARRAPSHAIPRWIEAAIPLDYARVVLEDASDATPAGWNVVAPRAIRKVFLPAANFYVLAERAAPPPGALAVRERDTTPTLYWIDYETQAIRSVGPSVIEAMRAIPDSVRR